jgi:predicted DNA-binding ribbon-helix-helix protein
VPKLEIRNFLRPEDGERTTVAIETEFWEAIENIASEKQTTWGELVTDLCHKAGKDCNRARMLRLFVLEDFKTKLTHKRKNK